MLLLGKKILLFSKNEDDTFRQKSVILRKKTHNKVLLLT